MSWALFGCHGINYGILRRAERLTPAGSVCTVVVMFERFPTELRTVTAEQLANWHIGFSARPLKLTPAGVSQLMSGCFVCW